MKKHSYLVFIVVGLIGLFPVYDSGEKAVDIIKDLDLRGKPAENAGKVKLDVNFGKIPLYFIHNKGQVNKKAAFYARTSRYTLWITKESLVFDSPYSPHSPHSPYSTKPSKYLRDISRLMFIGAKKNPEMVPIDETRLRVNYFKGNNPSGWNCDIPTSQAVLYKDLYKNINLKVYGIEKQIEYDWIVKPGGNPGNIRFQYKNVKGTRLDEQGNLLIETDFGRLVHKKPVGYQRITCPSSGNKNQIDVDVTFKKIGKNSYGFAVGEYDERCELIIDPVVLAYSTYLGGKSLDHGMGAAVDNSGNVYVTGYTASSDFPTLDQEQYPSDYDVFVTKIDTTQSGEASLVYSTYLGGEYLDFGMGIAVDSSGNVYVGGETWSTGFPIVNQYQTDQPFADAFIIKLDTTLAGASGLIYSTYLGGRDFDYGRSIVLDSSGYIYLTGFTKSTDFPTLNQYQTDQPGYDAFIAKIDTTQAGGASLIYSTYLGGDSDDWGIGITVAPDISGYVYVTGNTSSTDFPTLYQYQPDQPDDDVFVTMIDTTQIGAECLLYSTYLGGEDYDAGHGIAVDSIGNAYVTGYTASTDFPILNYYQANQPGDDAFVAKIDTTQSGASCLIYSTYLGGSGSEKGYGIAVDSTGNVYVTGCTASTDFPTLNQFQANQPGDDAFVTRIDTTRVGTSSLIYSTYLGGGFADKGEGIAVDSSGCAYLTGNTNSGNFPILDQYQEYPGDSLGNAFVTKLAYEALPAASITVTCPNGGENLDAGSVYTITWTSEGLEGNVNIEYSTDNGGSWTGIAYSTPNDGSRLWTVPNVVSNQCLIRVSANDADEGPADVSDNVFSIVSLVPGSITLRSPNGGETWLAGSLQEIKWNSSGDINHVTITYSTDNGTTWKTIAKTATNDGSFNWTIPDTVSDKCLVQVTSNDEFSDPKPSDVSDSVFSIVLPPPPTITVTAPNGGEQLPVGSRFDIAWYSSGTREDVKIEYSVNGGDTWMEITAAGENNGKYEWTVPDTPSDNCLVRISEIDGQPEDVSNAVFSIVSPSPGDITVTSPNGGETWEVGSSYEIKWTGTGIDVVTIEYSQDYGTTWQTIVQTTPNSGSFDWAIPDIASDQCLVRVTANDGGGDPRPTDVSDEVFSIVLPPPPTITVTAPNGGEQLAVGSRFDITWLSSGTREAVKIEYSVNSGDTWMEIAAAAENNGKYDWLVPDTPSETCLVRIGETGGEAMDISDAVFSIVQPVPGEITVTSPNGGETWTAGSLQEIKWTGSGDINNVTIKYSLDNGVTWKVITQSTANNGSFDWTIPETVSDRCLVRVRANDDDLDPKPSDVGDDVFSIVSSSGSFKVTSPNGGETWEVGSDHAITWTGTGDISDVMIEYSFDNGNTWSTIVSSAVNTGTYDWSVPDTVSQECLVRVTANDGGGDPKPSDVGDEVFSIVPPSLPTITVLTPNGGEELPVGTRFNITWYTTDTREQVKIEYTVNGGETWTEIVGAAENDGDYDWMIPDEPSQTCLVRISEIDGEPVDLSDAVFSIVSPSGDIIVTSPNGGENLEAGSGYDITWDSSGIDNVDIKYSIDNGVTWTPIGSAPGFWGIYDWVVPETPSETCLVQITSTDAGPDPGPADISDAVFSINLPVIGAIRVDSPNGGEILTPGSQYDITWTGTGVDNVIIEYSIDNGAEWIYIDTVAAGEGYYTWTVPQVPSDSCLIRISKNGSEEPPFDLSDAVFTISI
jgi:hypothetical protein